MQKRKTDKGAAGDKATIAATITPPHEPIIWKARWQIEKYEGDLEALRAAGEQPTPYEVIKGEDNLVMYGGVSCLWECLIGNGTGTTGQNLTFFNNANAYIGVGDSSTAEAATQTDLQAATNKLRKAMDPTYPAHTDGLVSGAATITFRSTFGTSDANYVWNEWGIFNGSSVGRMLNRKVANQGTKAGGSWVFTITITIS